MVIHMMIGDALLLLAVFARIWSLITDASRATIVSRGHSRELFYAITLVHVALSAMVLTYLPSSAAVSAAALTMLSRTLYLIVALQQYYLCRVDDGCTRAIVVLQPILSAHLNGPLPFYLEVALACSCLLQWWFYAATDDEGLEDQPHLLGPMARTQRHR